MKKLFISMMAVVFGLLFLNVGVWAEEAREEAEPVVDKVAISSANMRFTELLQEYYYANNGETMVTDSDLLYDHFGIDVINPYTNSRVKFFPVEGMSEDNLLNGAMYIDSECFTIGVVASIEKKLAYFSHSMSTSPYPNNFLDESITTDLIVKYAVCASIDSLYTDLYMEPVKWQLYQTYGCDYDGSGGVYEAERDHARAFILEEEEVIGNLPAINWTSEDGKEVKIDDVVVGINIFPDPTDEWLSEIEIILADGSTQNITFWNIDADELDELKFYIG